MSDRAALLIFVGLLMLAAAVVYHAQSGRYAPSHQAFFVFDSMTGDELPAPKYRE